MIIYNVIWNILIGTAKEQNNIIYTNENMIDHRSYTYNLSSCENKAWKKFRP